MAFEKYIISLEFICKVGKIYITIFTDHDNHAVRQRKLVQFMQKRSSQRMVNCVISYNVFSLFSPSRGLFTYWRGLIGGGRLNWKGGGGLFNYRDYLLELLNSNRSNTLTKKRIFEST